jgi:hypothetical protein
LIDEIATKDKFMQNSIARAKKITSNRLLALRMAKRCTVKAQHNTREDGIKWEEGILPNFGGQTIRMKP